jgi:hypothetical protein
MSTAAIVRTKPAAARPPSPPRPARAADTSKEAKQRAAAILEVLAGLRLPSEAAAALGVSLPRYYLLEAQGLAGLVAGCEPRPHGRTRTPERALAKLRKEVERLQREGARQQALVRAAQRTIGLTLPETPKARSATGKKRRRRPSVRALKAAARLQSDAQRQEVAAAASGPAVNGDGAVTLKAIP